jgi:hypothetical protein
MLASLFWWCYVRTNDFRLDIRGVGEEGQRQILVSHADGSLHDLLILVPGMRAPYCIRVASEPISRANFYQQSASGNIPDVALAEGERMRGMLSRAGIEVDVRSVILAVREVAQRGDFQIVVSAEPDQITTEAPVTTGTAVRSFIAPAPPLAITLSDDQTPVATAGVVGMDGTGGLLVITACHAVSAAAAQAREILVGGAVARFIGCHELTDSCLVSVVCAASSGAGQAGLLRLAPAEHRPATFDGAASGHKQTWIRGYDLSVLDPSPYLSSKVYTDPDTIPGDSGSALIDSDDHIVGFAVSRTALGAPLEFSTWSWAEQVLVAHGLA